MNFNGLPATAMGTEGLDEDSNINALDLPYDQWVSLPISGLKPSARYKHAAAIAGEKLYVTGGSRNGRYLSDIQVLDLRTLKWSAVKPYPDSYLDKPLDVLPASSGHSLVQWGNKLLVVAGHMKASSDTVTVWSIDIETHHSYVVKTSGKAPVAREGQSVALVGSRLIMFGGEDFSRRLLNDLFILDLETMAWEEVETMQRPPAPRFDHTAAVHAERYLLIFGGCSHSTCFNDLHVLDLQSMEWSQPQIQGEGVTARAGHAGAAIDDSWYIVGGGDNKTGASETLVLNMSKLVWSVVTNVKERDPLASEISHHDQIHPKHINLPALQFCAPHFSIMNCRAQIMFSNALFLFYGFIGDDAKPYFPGLSLCSTIINGEKLLVAFGGYNGKYNNEVFVLKPKPRDSSRPKIFQSPAAAAAAASVTAAYALTTTTTKKLDHINMVEAPPEELKTDIYPLGVKVDVDKIREEKKKLESTLEEVRKENSRFKGVLDEMNSNHTELSKELHSVQGQLEAERSRCFKLEVQIAELRKSLEPLHTIKHELQMLQQQRTAWEQEMELAAADGEQRNTSGGVWRWIAG